MKNSFCCSCTAGPKNSKKVAPTVSAPLHLILRAPSPASHEWKKVPGVKRLCQLCHLTVNGQGVICKNCGLKAHMLCSNGTYYPTPVLNVLNQSSLTSSTPHNPTASIKGALGNNPHSNSFEPRIKKLLHVAIPVPPPNSVTSDLSHSTRLSSCGDYSIAASTAIVVGTTTVSTETPRSQSKTPEITITPGSGIAEDSRTGSLEERPTDSGCAGLLDIEEADGDGGGSSQEENQSITNTNILIKRSESAPVTKSVSGPIVESESGIRYVDGPLDGALYALVSPVKIKAPSSADSGISFTVDQMKDLDRLLNALVQDAESIPDVRPYHAREDSLPFSYGVSDPALLKHRQDKTINRIHSHYAAASTPSPSNNYSSVRVPPYSASASTSNNPTTSFRYGTTEARTSSASTDTPTYYQKVNQLDKLTRPQRQTETQVDSPALRVHHLHLDLDASRTQNEPNRKDYSDSYSYSSSNYASPIGRQESTNGRNSNQHHMIYSTPVHHQNQSHSQPPPSSASFNNLNNLYGSTNTTNQRKTENNTNRFRSQSADGRGRNEDSDAWLARQMQRLEEKKARKYSVNNDWLAELKRTLPIEKPMDQSTHSGSAIINHLIRPSSSLGVSNTATPRPQHNQQVYGYGRSNVSTPVGYGGGLYSSDDEEFDREVEREMFQPAPTPSSLYNNRGRRVQRYHSENAYDRIYQQQHYQQRAPSAQSNISDMSMSIGQTPGFPTCPPTPYLNRPVSPAKPPRSPKGGRRSIPSTPTSPATPTASTNEWNLPTTNGTTIPITNNATSTIYAHRNLRSQTPVNPQPVHMVESDVRFTRDLSSFWYKPNATREETISALRFQPVGSFIIRNSNSFPGAYGIAVKANEQSSSDQGVRHFLIEPTKYGVRLRGSAVEPVFGSLSALVYAHSIEQMALPTKLVLPTADTVLPASQSQSTTAHLLTQGAACQLLFLGVIGVECVTGDDACMRGINAVSGAQSPTVVNLRLSKQGLTLTDIYRQRFFRLHFPLSGISYAATDPSNRTISHGGLIRKIFAVIARVPSASENSCIVLAELEQEQPANAIVAFFQRVIAWQN